MSDKSIILVPDDPRFIPDAARQRQARDRFAEIASESDEIDIKVSERIEFFDCGANLERILCPSCGAEIPIAWWQDRMAEDYDDGFRLVTYATPCCGGNHTLNDLVYERPQRFGRFAIAAMNQNYG